jgi:hypothetical protein
VQFTVPPGAVGQHIIAIKTTVNQTDALFNVLNGVTLVNGADIGTGASTPINPVPLLSPIGATTIAGQYGDLIFAITALINVSPTVANVGSTLGLSGGGLAPATTYYVSIASKSSELSIGSVTLAQFTTDASGNVPSGSSLKFPAAPSDDDHEAGTAYTVFVSTGKQSIDGVNSGTGTFVLQGALFLNATAAPAGHVVSVTGSGLGAGETYNIVFNYAQTSSGTSFTGTVLGAFSTNSLGAANSAFTVPAGAAPGTYVVQLQDLDGDQSLGVLSIPPSLTVGGTTGNAVCSDTTCMSISGTATLVNQGTFKAISVSYVNNSNQTQTAVVYAVVHNAQGQTVSISTATITPAAKATTTAFPVLFGLPSGTYSVTLFVTSTSGLAISTTSTVSVTL